MDDFEFETTARAASTKQISVHRAFFYSAGIPGWGEYHVGRKVRGLLTFLIFTALTAWFFYLSVRTGQILIDYASSFFVEGGPADWSLINLPSLSLAASISGLYLVWMWGIFAAVHAAVQERAGLSAPSQASAAWGAFMSWLCPGTGQAYTGRPSLGLALLIGYFTGTALLFPAYSDFIKSLLDMLKGGEFTGLSSEMVLSELSGPLYGLELSPAKLIQMIVSGLALAETMSVLSGRWRLDDKTWTSHPAFRALGLFVLGWLGPGTGQMLQGRGAAGWLFLGIWMGIKVLAALLFREGLLTASDVKLWLDIRDWIMLAAMLEAPAFMVYLNIRAARSRRSRDVSRPSWE